MLCHDQLLVSVPPSPSIPQHPTPSRGVERMFEQLAVASSWQLLQVGSCFKLAVASSYPGALPAPVPACPLINSSNIAHFPFTSQMQHANVLPVVTLSLKLRIQEYKSRWQLLNHPSMPLPHYVPPCKSPAPCSLRGSIHTCLAACDQGAACRRQTIRTQPQKNTHWPVHIPLAINQLQHVAHIYRIQGLGDFI